MAAHKELPGHFPGDQPITPALAQSLGLSPEELATLQSRLGRTPSYTELGIWRAARATRATRTGPPDDRAGITHEPPRERTPPPPPHPPHAGTSVFWIGARGDGNADALTEVCGELVRRGVVVTLHDVRDDGLAASSIALAASACGGIELNLDLVPRRVRRMSPYEILVGEARAERLLLVERGTDEAVLEICAKGGVDVAVIGEVTDAKRLIAKATPGFDPFDDAAVTTNPIVAADLPLEALSGAGAVAVADADGRAKGASVRK